MENAENRVKWSPFAMVTNFIKELYMQLKSWILGKRVILTRSTNDWRAVKQTCDAMNDQIEKCLAKKPRKPRTKKNLTTQQD